MSQSLQSESVRLKFTLENQIRAIRAAEAIEIELRDYPNDTDIRAEYKKSIAVLKNQNEFNASHILVETEEKAISIFEKLRLGSNFEIIAKQESIGPSAENSGSLGWFSVGQMVPEFEAAARH